MTSNTLHEQAMQTSGEGKRHEKRRHDQTSSGTVKRFIQSIFLMLILILSNHPLCFSQPLPPQYPYSNPVPVFDPDPAWITLAIVSGWLFFINKLFFNKKRIKRNL